MEQAMLSAAQDAALAAQSSARAAWWGVSVSGIAAFATVGTLWYAVNQAARGARFERMQAAKELARLSELLGPLVQDVPVDETGYVADFPGDEEARKVLVKRAVLGFQTVAVEHLPHVSAVRYVEVARMQLAELDRDLSTLGPLFLHFEASFGMLAEAHDYFNLVLRVLEQNSPQAKRELQHRFGH